MRGRYVDGLKVMSLRLDEDMTQEDLAEKSGVSRVQIQRIEGGNGRNSKVVTVSRLASALGVSIEDITVEEITNEMEN